MEIPTLVVTDASLDRADAAPVVHKGVRFEGARFIGLRRMRGRIRFEACTFVDCEFIDCDLDTGFASGLAYPESASTLRRVRFVRCRLKEAYLGGVTLQECEFEDCDFDHVSWSSVDLIGCVFRGEVMGMNLFGHSGPIVRPPPNHREKLPPRANRIAGNDFSGADLRGVGLRDGVPIHDQRWPDDPDYVILDRIPERVRLAVAALGEATDLQSNVVVRLLANETRTGQHTDIYRYEDPAMPPTHHRMVRMLADVVLPASH